MATHTAKLFQNGDLLVAKESNSEESLFRDMAALVTIHEQDGPIEIRMDGKVWKPAPRQDRIR